MFTDPERILLVALLVTAFVQVVKMCIPLLNGWAAVAFNAVFSAIAIFVIFRFELTWNLLSVYLLTALAAAGIHGTATKISDYPNPHENPTPSGTPAQNYRVHIE